MKTVEVHLQLTDALVKSLSVKRPKLCTSARFGAKYVQRLRGPSTVKDYPSVENLAKLAKEHKCLCLISHRNPSISRDSPPRSSSHRRFSGIRGRDGGTSNPCIA